MFASIPVSSGLVYAFCLLASFLSLLFTFTSHSDKHLQIKGCRRVGLRKRSNLDDEHDEKYSSGTEESTDQSGRSRWKVKSLFIYPIKSCRGVELEESVVVSTGLNYDRQFSFAILESPFPLSSNASQKDASDHKWKFITQRQVPLLARVKTEVWVPDPSCPTYSPDLQEVQSGGVVVIKFPYQEDGWKGILAHIKAIIHGISPERSFSVPFNPTQDQTKEKGYEREVMKIWKDSPLALNMKSSVPPELRYFLGVSHVLTLFRVDPSAYREVYRCAPRQDQLGYQPITGFADSYPLHLLNIASIHDVGSRVEKGTPRLSTFRFRGNIIVTGPRAYAEDDWKRIRIGKEEYYTSCRTTRCLQPNVDQLTGEKHPKEPNRTLRSFRCIDKGAGNNACLGMQMVPALEKGSIRVGDTIEVLETGEHYYIPQ